MLLVILAPRLFLFADFAWRLVFTLLVVALAVDASERSLEHHHRFFILIRDAPAGQLVKTLQGSVIWSPSGIIAEKSFFIAPVVQIDYRNHFVPVRSHAHS